MLDSRLIVATINRAPGTFAGAQETETMTTTTNAPRPDVQALIDLFDEQREALLDTMRQLQAAMSDPHADAYFFANVAEHLDRKTNRYNTDWNDVRTVAEQLAETGSINDDDDDDVVYATD